MPASNAYQPGQVYLGSKLNAEPQVFAASVTTLAGVKAGGNVPSVAILRGSGTVGSITGQTGFDQAGSFVLNAGTATIVGGSLASVTFGTPLAAAPSAVIVNAGITAGTVSFAVAPVSVTNKGFVVQGGAPTSGTAYLISYQVIQ